MLASDIGLRRHLPSTPTEVPFEPKPVCLYNPSIRSYKKAHMNTLRTTFLMALMTVLVMFAGRAIGGQNGMLTALLLAGIMNFVTYWFSDKIVLRMYHAEPVTEASAPELYSIVRGLTTKGQLPMPKIYIIPNDTPNAFATGRNPEHSAVAVTSGLLRILDRNELSGVLGHELSHVQNRDILIGTIAATLAGAISFLAQMGQWAMIFGGRHSSSDDRDGNPIGALLMIILAPIAAMLIQMAVSRTREYGADARGAQLCGNPRYLASALRKLERGAQAIPMDAQPATAHMFIVNPFSGRGGLVNLFRTHPSTEDRVARLEAMARGVTV
jgi:heat shock protein HtpX